MSDTAPAPVRTRFAPSPTGHLHVGGARTALFCWAYARGRGGRFILRIEDTDRRRSSDAATRALMEDLAWLEIGWDEGPLFDGLGGGDAGPYIQSLRLDIYRHHADALVASGAAYRAFETPQELAAAHGRYRESRAALRLDPQTVERYLRTGRPHVIRFKAPDEGRIVIVDAIRGDTIVGASEIDDFIIMKADGYPTYHFAVVVDDELMGVTHVIRAQEHLYNTARHVLLQDALKFRKPVYAHVSLIFNPDGSKMSKRDRDGALRREVATRGLREPPLDPTTAEPVVPGDAWHHWIEDEDRQLEPPDARSLARALRVALPEIDVEDFRRAGYLPEVMVNYLALLGWSPPDGREKFDRRYLVEHFDLDRVIRSPAKFDRDKLLHFNNDAINAMEPQEFTARLREHARRYHPEFPATLGEDRFALFAGCNRARSRTLEDPFRDRFFVMGDDQIVYEPSRALHKALCGGTPSGYAHLEALLPVLRALAPWTVKALEEAITRYAAGAAGGQLGRVAQPLRVAVSGGVVSPAIFETLAILGRDPVLRRIERCLALRPASEPATEAQAGRRGRQEMSGRGAPE